MKRTFLNKFADYLESVVFSPEPLLITGDFNIHVDNINDLYASRFNNLLESVHLDQHVHCSTCSLHGHTLNLIITRQSESVIISPPTADYMISDHI